MEQESVVLKLSIVIFWKLFHWFYNPENLGKETKFVTLAKVLSELQL